MLSPMSLSGESVSILQARRLSVEQMDDFSALLEQAHQKLDGQQDVPKARQTTAKQVLSGLSSDDLHLVQQAAGLVDRILVSSLSEEGATNLLVGRDQASMVDLNNDGLVEIGAGKMITFPPVNAPEYVHQAWAEAIEDLPDDGTKLHLQLQMHTMTYGVRINDQATKQALAPEQQWSTAGWKSLMKNAWAGLEFAVAHDGWTKHNVLTQEVYDRFEEALDAGSDE